MIPKVLKTCNNRLLASLLSNTHTQIHIYLPRVHVAPSSCSSLYVCAHNIAQMKVSSSESLRTLGSNYTNKLLMENWKQDFNDHYLFNVRFTIFWIFDYTFTWFKKYTRV